MTKSKHKDVASFHDDVEKFQKRTKDLWSKGFAPITTVTSFDGKTEKLCRRMEENETRYEDSIEVGRKLSFERFRTANVIDGVGKGLGYIKYGDDDLLPVVVEKLANALPFTAQGLDYLKNMLAGNGLEFNYEYTKVIGEEVREVCIPYECAGSLIIRRIKTLRDRIANPVNTSQEGEEQNRLTNGTKSVTVSSQTVDTKVEPVQYRRKREPEPDPSAKYANENYEDIGTDEQQLQEAIAEYRKWKETMDWIKEFGRNSGSLADLVQQWAHDSTFYNLAFMRLILEQGVPGSWGKVDGTGNNRKLVKRPRIIGMTYQPLQCSRFEAQDENLHINYVYYAERWRFNNSKKDGDQKPVAYDCIEPATRWRDLENIVMDNQGTKPSSRPSVCAPLYIKGTNSPYYPTCPWWSIFSSMIYFLTFSQMTDMATAKRNSTMWSKIVFIDVEWFEKYLTQKGCETDEQRQAEREAFVQKIKEFLSHKDNQGGVISGDKITTPDGKTSYAIEVVDVPQPTSKASLEDLEKLTSCIFFALGIHPALVGAIPGANKSSSGTQQRELALLKMLSLNPQQSRIISLFEFIRDWNDLDTHLSINIKKYILSTLDRSDTGLVEDKDN